MTALSSCDCETSKRISWNNLVRLITALVLVLAPAVSEQPVWVDEAFTARNKAVVRDFYTTVLIGRDVDAAPRFLRPDYIQHNPQVPTRLKGFMDTFRDRFAQNPRPTISVNC